MFNECSQNARGMAAEYGLSVQEFKQNAAGIPRMYLECNTNVSSVSRIWPEYFLIGYKMMPFSSVSTQPLDEEDPQSFNYLRMEPAMFDELVQRVGPKIEKQDTNVRKALPRQA